MEERENTTVSDTNSEASPEVSLVSDQASQDFVGRWNRLVSTTNWEKGRIIAQWREALAAAGASPLEFSDDAWSRRVGGVTGQHVGRLRRVFHRFGQTCEKFPGLYWSHFQAALDWDDAEMWLEGAVHNAWSVADMRNMRAETLGGVESVGSGEFETTSSDLDEDFVQESKDQPRDTARDPNRAESAGGPSLEGPDFGDEPDSPGVAFDESAEPPTTVPVTPAIRPFQHLPKLPGDLSDAFESFKLAILRHKTDGWRDVSAQHVLDGLDALKALVTAPSEA